MSISSNVYYPQAEILPTCQELGIGIVAYLPLRQGFLAGAITSRDDLAADDLWLISPRLSEESFCKVRSRIQVR